MLAIHRRGRFGACSVADETWLQGSSTTLRTRRQDMYPPNTNSRGFWPDLAIAILGSQVRRSATPGISGLLT